MKSTRIVCEKDDSWCCPRCGLKKDVYLQEGEQAYHCKACQLRWQFAGYPDLMDDRLFKAFVYVPKRVKIATLVDGPGKHRNVSLVSEGPKWRGYQCNVFPGYRFLEKRAGVEIYVSVERDE